jgi:hypothetical protein
MSRSEYSRLCHCGTCVGKPVGLKQYKLHRQLARASDLLRSDPRLVPYTKNQRTSSPQSFPHSDDARKASIPKTPLRRPKSPFDSLHEVLRSIPPLMHQGVKILANKDRCDLRQPPNALSAVSLKDLPDLTLHRTSPLAMYEHKVLSMRYTLGRLVRKCRLQVATYSQALSIGVELLDERVELIQRKKLGDWEILRDRSALPASVPVIDTGKC